MSNKTIEQRLTDEQTLAHIKLEVLKCALGIKSLDERQLFNRLEKLWLDAFESGSASSNAELAIAEQYPKKCVRCDRVTVERDVARKLLKDYLHRFPAFRTKPIGAPHSKTRGEQDSHIALEDLARKVFT